MAVTTPDATAPTPQFHRTKYHSPNMSEPLKAEERIPPQADQIVGLLKGTRYYTVEKVVLGGDDEVKLIVVHPPHQNSLEGHSSILQGIHKESGLPIPTVTVDNYDSRHPTGTVELNY